MITRLLYLNRPIIKRGIKKNIVKTSVMQNVCSIRVGSPQAGFKYNETWFLIGENCVIV